MEIEKKYLDLLTRCILATVFALYSVAVFTPIIDPKNVNLAVIYVLTLIVAIQRKRLQDMTPRDIIVLGLFFFSLDI